MILFPTSLLHATTIIQTNKWRSSVIAISITRMAMYFHVGTTFMEHYNDETCKWPTPPLKWALTYGDRLYFSGLFLDEYRNLARRHPCLSSDIASPVDRYPRQTGDLWLQILRTLQLLETERSIRPKS